MKITAKTLNEHLQEIAKQLNLATNRDEAAAKNLTHYLYLDHNSVYGGYRIVNVNIENGGRSGAFGGNGTEARINAKAMYMKLDSILNGVLAAQTK